MKKANIRKFISENKFVSENNFISKNEFISKNNFISRNNFISENKELIGLLLLFLIVRGISMLRYHLPFWDEAVYIGIGKYIYSWGGIGLWEDIRPLVFPIVLGFFMFLKIPLQYLEIVPIFFSLGTIILTYTVSKRFFGKTVGLLSTVFLLITPVFHLYSYYYLTEIPSTFFGLLAIYLFLQSRYFWSGIVAGIAFMTKFPQGLIFLALFILISAEFMIFDKGKNNNKNNKNKKNNTITNSINNTTSKNNIDNTTSKNNITNNITNNKNSNNTNNKKIIKKIIANKIFIYSLGFLIILFAFLIFNIIMYDDGNVIASSLHTFINARYHEMNPFQSIGITSIGTWLYNYLYYLIELVKSNYVLIFFIIGAISGAISIIFRKNIFRIKEIQKYLPIILPLLFLLLYFSIIPNKQLRFSLTFLPYFCVLCAIGASEAYAFFKNRILKVFIILLVVSLLITAVLTDVKYFSWKTKAEPAIVPELYATLPPDKTVLTSDPVFSVYSNDKFIPYYYSAEIAVAKYDINFIYDIYLNQSDIIIFNTGSLVCIENDIYCTNSVETIKAKINKNKLIRKYDYGSDTYYIYETIKN